MRKQIITIASAILATMSMTAQDRVFNNPDNEAYFGIRIGGDVTCPGKVTAGNIGINAFNNGGGFEFGSIYNIPVAANFYIEPGLKFYYDIYSVNDDFIGEIEGGSAIDNASIHKFGMRIPVMAGYHFDFTDDVKVSIFTGPELEVGFSAKEHVRIGSVSASESLYGEDGGMSRVNLLWGVGAGISYRKIYFGINGAIGMLNMYKDMSPAKFHENRVTFSLGYNF